jgi:hypothetical protein
VSASETLATSGWHAPATQTSSAFSSLHSASALHGKLHIIELGVFVHAIMHSAFGCESLHSALDSQLRVHTSQMHSRPGPQPSSQGLKK